MIGGNKIKIKRRRKQVECESSRWHEEHALNLWYPCRILKIMKRYGWLFFLLLHLIHFVLFSCYKVNHFFFIYKYKLFEYLYCSVFVEKFCKNIFNWNYLLIDWIRFIDSTSKIFTCCYSLFFFISFYLFSLSFFFISLFKHKLYLWRYMFDK